MKTRQGFVSNSSTTSFCIYGAFLESESSVADLLREGGCLDSIPEIKEKIEQYGDEPYEAICFAFSHFGLRVIRMEYDEGLYVGKELSDLKDDQTFGEFKDEVKGVFDKLLPGNDFKFSVIEEAWRDG